MSQPIPAAGTRADVPCESCRACCRHEIVALYPEHGDDPSNYLTTPLELGDRTIEVLQRKPNGDCVYLDDTIGCTIYDRAPAVCRDFDCRRFFLSMSRNERRFYQRKSKQKFEIFAAARSRLHTLTDQ